MSTHLQSKRLPVETDAARVAAELLAEAEGMGVIAPHESGDGRFDIRLVTALLHRLSDAGVGRRWVGAFQESEALRDDDLTDVLVHVRSALEESPLPSFEWPALLSVFGVDELSQLIGVSVSSANRYVRGTRATPDVVAERLHFVARIVGYLKGAYNDVGIRRWFQRPRSALNDRSPSELLTGDWSPADPGPVTVMELARSLLFAPAT